jgi:hypothetical protein
MATRDHTRVSDDSHRTPNGGGRIQRLTTETKSFFKTSEFVAYAIVFIGILIAANSIENAEGGRDFFTADKAWFYITLLTIGYMVSRGLAKAGVRDPYWSERGDSNADH